VNNAKVQLIIEELVTNVIVQNSPIIIDAQLAVQQVGTGNYLLSDLDTHKVDGFLRFAVSKELQFQETAVSKMHGEAGLVFLDLGGADFKIRDNSSERFTFSRTTGDFITTGDVQAYSDERLKYDIQPIKNALNKVKELQGSTFYKYVDPTKRNTGLIAQDVMKVLPEAVSIDENGYLAVSYGNIVGLLVEAIKELTGVIENVDKCGCSSHKTKCIDSESSQS
jgi:hypothetical protein